MSKNGCKNIVIEMSTWLFNYSSDVSKGCEQRKMTIIVTFGMKNPPKKLEVSMFLPRCQVLAQLFLRNSYLSKNLITTSGNEIQPIYQG